MQTGTTTTTAPPTSLATTRATEPEVLAGIESGKGQPVRYSFDVTPRSDSRSWMIFGAAAAMGLVTALLGGLGRRA